MARDGTDLRAWLHAFVFEAGFLARYPYYAHVLAALEPVLDPSVELLGVSLRSGASSDAARYYLHVNVEGVRRAPQFLRGLLLHEVHHVVLGHLAHPRFQGPEKPRLMEMAMETTANEHIEEPLPAPILWQHFERFGFKRGQSTMERYQLLCDAETESLIPQPKIPEPKPDTRNVDDHRWSEMDAPPAAGVEETRRVLEEADQKGTPPKEAREVPQRRITMAGKTPKELLHELGGTTDPREVLIDWKDALARFVAHRRAPVHTWSRPSRRFPQEIGRVPGRSYRPRTALRPTILVAIDTSLSMTDRELSEVARQLRPMREHAQLVIVEHDAKVTNVATFQGALTKVKGRGGTDLRVIFDPSLLRSTNADGVIAFTDGDGPTPERAPAIPVLWMLTKPWDFACPWGDRAKLFDR